MPSVYQSGSHNRIPGFNQFKPSGQIDSRGRPMGQNVRVPYNPNAPRVRLPSERSLQAQAWRESMESQARLANSYYTMQGEYARQYFLQEHSMIQFGIAQLVSLFQGQILGQIAIWEDFAKRLRDISKNQYNRMDGLMQEVAIQGRAATIAAYRPKGPSYRWADPPPYKRDAGGAMKRLLESDRWYRVHRDGITWVLPGVFDKTARQWYRLNFGAQPAPQRYPKGGMMKFFGKTIGYGPDMNSAPTSTSFFKPPGVRSNQALSKTPDNLSKLTQGLGGRAFYPAGAAGAGSQRALMGRQDENGNFKYDYQQAKLGNIKAFSGRQATKGIVGMRFLDAGIQQIARALPIAMEQLVFELVTKAAQKGSGKGSMKTYASQPHNYTKIADDMHAHFMKESDVRLAELRYAMAASNKKAEAGYLERLAVLAKMG